MQNKTRKLCPRTQLPPVGEVLCSVSTPVCGRHLNSLPAAVTSSASRHSGWVHAHPHSAPQRTPDQHLRGCPAASVWQLAFVCSQSNATGSEPRRRRFPDLCHRPPSPRWAQTPWWVGPPSPPSPWTPSASSCCQTWPVAGRGETNERPVLLPKRLASAEGKQVRWLLIQFITKYLFTKQNINKKGLNSTSAAFVRLKWPFDLWRAVWIDKKAINVYTI